MSEEGKCQIAREQSAVSTQHSAREHSRLKGDNVVGMVRGKAKIILLCIGVRRWVQIGNELLCCGSACGLRKFGRSRSLGPTSTPKRAKTTRVLGTPATRALTSTPFTRKSGARW